MIIFNNKKIPPTYNPYRENIFWADSKVKAIVGSLSLSHFDLKNES